jgi:hypothetical protein
MFIFNLFIQFFVVAMPTTGAAILPPQSEFFDYNKGRVDSDFNSFTGAAGASASSTVDTGTFTWSFPNLVQAFNVGMGMIGRVFFGYYEIGIYIADGVAPLETNSGAIHGLFGGIGTLFSILSIFGMLVLLRNLVFKV